MTADDMFQEAAMAVLRLTNLPTANEVGEIEALAYAAILARSKGIASKDPLFLKWGQWWLDATNPKV